MLKKEKLRLTQKRENVAGGFSQEIRKLERNWHDKLELQTKEYRQMKSIFNKISQTHISEERLLTKKKRTAYC